MIDFFQKNKEKTDKSIMLSIIIFTCKNFVKLVKHTIHVQIENMLKLERLISRFKDAYLDA